jgi:hypothetical protein
LGTVAGNVAGAGLEALVWAETANRQSAESTSRYVAQQTDTNAIAILWEQRVGGSNPSAPTIKSIA